MAAATQDICALEIEVTMGWNTDFKMSTTLIVAIFEVESNSSEFYDLNCKPDGGATGITGISTFGHVPAGECWIWFNVADDTGLYNATGKQIIVTGAPNIATGANEITGSIRLCEGGGWMVFNRTNSTAYPDMGQVNVSWTWGVNDMPLCSGLGIVFRDYRPRYYYGDLDCGSWQRIEGLTVPSYCAASPREEDVPILAPATMVALTRGMLCITSRGQDRKKKVGGHEQSL